MDLVPYTPPDQNWADNEAKLVSILEEKFQIENLKFEDEPEDVDALVSQGVDQEVLSHVKAKSSGNIAVDSTNIVREVFTGTIKRPGFDLVRIGNFAEEPDMLQVRNRILEVFIILDSFCRFLIIISNIGYRVLPSSSYCR